jgi:hypothetical protein
MEVDMKLWDAVFIDEFLTEFVNHLKKDDLRWGDTWLHRTREGQEERTELTFRDYFDKYRNANIPIDWLSVVGGAYICWLRERHPEMWTK